MNKILAVLLLAASTCALSDEGRIEISTPTSITQPGSYVLVNDLVAAWFPGITIASSEVKLDLNGFTIRQASLGATSGIVIDSDYKNIEVTNGAITGFSYNAIYVPGSSKTGRNLVFSRLRISNNVAAGIHTEDNPGFIVEGCILSENGSGISAYAAGLIRNNVVGQSTYWGIRAQSKEIGYRSNVLYGNGTDVDGLGTNLGDNLCSGALCP